MRRLFQVGVTRDLWGLHERTGVDIGLGMLDTAPGISYEPVESTGPELDSEDVAGYDGLLLLKPRVTAATLQEADRLSIIARWGVGYDNVDVQACSRHGVALTITPDGVRRPMAVAMLTMLLALSSNLVPKHNLMRAGGWDRESCLGTGLTGRTLGIVGLGNIGRELLSLAAPLGMRHVAYEPYPASVSEGPSVDLVTLDELLGTADFICICCPLNDDTRHLLNARNLRRLKPSACLVNAARGPIIDETALVETLRAGRIRGAALDVFEQEPLAADSPLRRLDNVILTPHSLGWTDEILTGNGRSACQALIDVSQGRVPAHLVNPEVLDHPRQRRSPTVPTLLEDP